MLEYADFMRTGNSAQEKLIDCQKPIIAAVHGYALGGLELALCCDIVVAGADARLGLPESKLGLLPGDGGTQRLPQLIGTVRAAELLMTGRAFSGAYAVAWGLSVGTGNADSAFDAAMALAQRICTTAPVAVAMAKALLREGADAPMAAGLRLEQSVGAMLFATDDAKEGIAAFTAKRKPRFTGQ